MLDTDIDIYIYIYIHTHTHTHIYIYIYIIYPVILALKLVRDQKQPVQALNLLLQGLTSLAALHGRSSANA